MPVVRYHWEMPGQMPHETAGSAVEFFWFAVVWHGSHGIKVERVLADNHKTQTHTALSPAS